VVRAGKRLEGTKEDRIRGFRTRTEQVDLRILVFLQAQASQLVLTHAIGVAQNSFLGDWETISPAP
jgi:hypothetical protein